MGEIAPPRCYGQPVFQPSAQDDGALVGSATVCSLPFQTVTKTDLSYMYRLKTVECLF